MERRFHPNIPSRGKRRAAVGAPGKNLAVAARRAGARKKIGRGPRERMRAGPVADFLPAPARLGRGRILARAPGRARAPSLALDVGMKACLLPQPGISAEATGPQSV